MSLVLTEESILRRVVAEEVERAVQPVLNALAQHVGAHAKDCGNELMTRQEVVDMLRIDARTLRRLVLEGDIPPPIILSERTQRWRRSEIKEWLGMKERKS